MIWTKSNAGFDMFQRNNFYIEPFSEYEQTWYFLELLKTHDVLSFRCKFFIRHIHDVRQCVILAVKFFIASSWTVQTEIKGLKCAAKTTMNNLYTDCALQ